MVFACAVACTHPDGVGVFQDSETATEKSLSTRYRPRSPLRVPDPHVAGNEATVGPPVLVPGVPFSTATVAGASVLNSIMCPRMPLLPALNGPAEEMPPGLPPVLPSPDGLYIHVSACAAAEFPAACDAIRTHGAPGPVVVVRLLTTSWTISKVPAVEFPGRVKVMLPEATFVAVPLCTRANPPTVPVPASVGLLSANPAPPPPPPLPDNVSGARAKAPWQAVWVTKLDSLTCPSNPAPLLSPDAPRAPAPPPGPPVGGEPSPFTWPPAPPGPPPVTAAAPSPATPPD